jgi:hypothetical protein
MAGFSLLDGALDVNEEVRQDGHDASDRRLTARTAPMMTASPSVPPANLIGATSSCRPPTNVMESGAAEPARSGLHSTDTMLAKEQCE